MADGLIVAANVLWTCSLALSIIAGLYTITAQQWVRRLTPPSHLTPAESVRLREFRSTGIERWKVAEIIDALPLIVQLSVILFLAGMACYLDTLNAVVSRAFTIMVTVFMGFWLVSTILPLVRSDCPYKGPFVPATMTIAEVGFYLVAFIFAGVLLALLQLVSWTVSFVEQATCRDLHRNAFHARAVRFLDCTILELTQWATYYGLHLRTSLSYSTSLWMHHELSWIEQEQHAHDLDRAAICTVARVAPKDAAPRLFNEGLTYVPSGDPLGLATRYISVHLEMHHLGVFALLKPTALIFLGDFAAYHDILYDIREGVWKCLLQALPSDSVAGSDRACATLLCFVYRSTLSKYFKDPGQDGTTVTPFSLQHFSELLYTLRKKQTKERIVADEYTRFATSMLFQCCRRCCTLQGQGTKKLRIAGDMVLTTL